MEGQGTRSGCAAGVFSAVARAMRTDHSLHDARILQPRRAKSNVSGGHEGYRVSMVRCLGFAARICSVALLGITLAISSARADGVLGAWSTPDGHGVVAIEQCGDALCGRIVG